MRLLLVAPLLGGSGRVPDVFETLGPLLEAAGHEVAMTSTEPRAPVRALRMAATTARRRGEVDAVLVHLYSGRALLVEDVVARLAGRAPLVGFLSGGGFPDFAVRHPRWVPNVLDRFSHLVAPSGYLARWAATQSDTPVSTIPNPLDLEPYPYRARSVIRPHVLWMRAYHDIYAPEVAIRAARLLAERYDDVALHMVGADKGLRPGLVRLVQQLGLGEQVRVEGFAGPEAKLRLLSSHDVFWNTSRVDNRPVSVVEAAASGLCVVSTRVGGVPDLVEDGVSARLVPPDDPTALAEATAELVDDPVLAARISEGGRSVAEAGRPELVTAEWQRLLSAVAS